MRLLILSCAVLASAMLTLPSAASAYGASPFAASPFATCKWHVVTSPNPLPDQNYLGTVSATSNEEFWRIRSGCVN